RGPRQFQGPQGEARRGWYSPLTEQAPRRALPGSAPPMEPGTPRDGDCMRPPLVLTIAASESDAAAGLQADLQPFTALGAYGSSAVSLATTGTAHRVRGSPPLPADVVRGQLEAVAEDLGLHATQIGALGSAAVVEAVADAVRTHRDRLGRIVLVAVMVGANGTPLISAEGAAALGAQLLPLADLLTPNMAEAAQLLGRPLATSIEEM